MADPRFFRRLGPYRLEDIADAVNADLLDPSTKDVMIYDIASLDAAGSGDLSFFTDSLYQTDFRATRASAVVTTRELARNGPSGLCLMSVAEPQLAFAQIGLLYYPAGRPEPRISADARIDPSAVIGEASRIDAGAVVGAGAEIGSGCHIACHAVIGSGVVLGDDCAIGANSSCQSCHHRRPSPDRDRVSIGGQGFGFVPTSNGRLRIRSLAVLSSRTMSRLARTARSTAVRPGTPSSGPGLCWITWCTSRTMFGLDGIALRARQVGIAGSTVVGDGVMMEGRSASATI